MPRSRPRFGWMDGVRMALRAKDITVEQGKQIALKRREWAAIVRG